MGDPQPNPGGNVYKRDTPEDLHEAWNAVIRKVNDERENPPEDTDCEALSSIEEVEVDHIWTKQDVEEVRDAIDEMCEFSWEEDLEYWKDEIITEIEDALDRELGGWGDEDECCEEECIPACEDCDEESDTFQMIAASGCLVEQWPACAIDHIQWRDVRDAARDWGSIMGPLYNAISLFNYYHPQYCRLVEECEEIEEEIEQLEEQLAALQEARDEECAKPEPNNCWEARQRVDDKQEEIDEKRDELEEKEEERDQAQEDMDSASEEADSYAITQGVIINNASSPHAQNMWPMVTSTNHPWSGQDCETKHGHRGVSRCKWGWSLGFRHEGGEWNVRWSGWYTPNGVPYATSLSINSPFASYYCVSCCWGLGGGGSPDWCYDPRSTCGSAGSCPSEWRLHAHADQTSCDAYDPSTGEPC